jgi:hypothetical protein
MSRGRPVPKNLAWWLERIGELPGALADPASRWRQREAEDPRHVEFQLLMAYRVLREIARHPDQIVEALRRVGYSGGRLILDDHRKLGWELDPLMTALVEVEVDRIRECARCQRIYWARRSDQLCCSRECGHVLRSRTYRKKQKQQRRPIVLPVKRTARQQRIHPTPRRKKRA